MVRASPSAASSSAGMAFAPRYSSTSGFTGFTGFDGFKITSPAVVALVGYAILAFIVLLPVKMNTWDDQRNEFVAQKYNFLQRLLLVLLLLFPFLLSVYSVNCMVVGDCMAWSWIVAIVTILWAAVVAVTTFATGGFQLDQVV
jgi:hypothetical protein